MDTVNLIVSIASFALAIFVFIWTANDAKKATIAQTKEQNTRATLTDFGNPRREHQDFEAQLREHPERRAEILKGYLADLERFAVGCNRGAYDLEVVSSMSGGMLMSQYRNHFRAFIAQARGNVRLDASALYRERLYCEYVEMMRRLFEMRGEAWQDVERISDDQWMLQKFLGMPIDSPEKVLKLFAGLPGAVRVKGEGRQGFVYVPGTLPVGQRAVLAAHADTVFDEEYVRQGHVEATGQNAVVFEDGWYRGTNPAVSIGADDRAGCAMLWAMRKSGHSLLVTDGEEHGQIGAHFLRDSCPEVFAELQAHAFMVQLDRRGASDYKCYELPVTPEFLAYVEAETGYVRAEGKGRTDIQVLCGDVCGVNLSVGYYDEHKPEERVCLAEWQH
ncbi:MAG: hypothetical protein IJG53_01800, partial [Eggerthellaceae bacterium]|nr:hypothetical protein [Eggerthellaceae bacterium]